MDSEIGYERKKEEFQRSRFEEKLEEDGGRQSVGSGIW